MSQETSQAENIAQHDQRARHKLLLENALRAKDDSLQAVKTSFDEFVNTLITTYNNTIENKIKSIIEAPVEITHMPPDIIIAMISVDQFVPFRMAELAFALDEKRSSLFALKQAELKNEGFLLERRVGSNGFLVTIRLDIGEPKDQREFFTRVLIAGWLFCEEALATPKKFVHINTNQMLRDLVTQTHWKVGENPFQVLHLHYTKFKKGYLYHNDRADVIGMSEYIPKDQLTARHASIQQQDVRPDASEKHKYQVLSQEEEIPEEQSRIRRPQDLRHVQQELDVSQNQPRISRKIRTAQIVNDQSVTRPIHVHHQAQIVNDQSTTRSIREAQQISHVDPSQEQPPIYRPQARPMREVRQQHQADLSQEKEQPQIYRPHAQYSRGGGIQKPYRSRLHQEVNDS